MSESFFPEGYFPENYFPENYFPDGDPVVVSVLFGPARTNIRTTAVDLSVQTTKVEGTAYYVVTQSATRPSIAQIKAGQDHAGAAAAADGSTAVVAQNILFTDAGPLTAGENYWAHFVQTDVLSADSNRVSTAEFITPATAPVIDIPANTPRRRPRTRRTTQKAVVVAVDGATEQKYPAYRFAGRQFFERQSGHTVTPEE